MSPLELFKTVINALKSECLELAAANDIFLEVDEAGNIWLADGEQDECVRMYGWHCTYQKINRIISSKNSSNEIES